MIQYIEALIWPFTIIFIFLGGLKYLYKKSAFKETLSDFIARINSMEAKQDDHTTEIDDKISKHGKMLEKNQADITALKVHRGIGGQ